MYVRAHAHLPNVAQIDLTVVVVIVVVVVAVIVDMLRRYCCFSQTDRQTHGSGYRVPLQLKTGH